MAAAEQDYYLPNPSHWPIVGSIGLFLLLGGFACYLSGITSGPVAMIIGFAVVVFMMFGWFGTVIGESETGRYNDQVDMSFRMGMGWFIFSEVLFFAAFFGALFYARVYSVPWMGGEGVGAFATHPVLWPDYESAWPTNGPANIGDAFETIPAFGIPALNTIILLTSGGHGYPGALGAEEEPARPPLLLALRDRRARRGLSLLPGSRSSTMPTPTST